MVAAMLVTGLNTLDKVGILMIVDAVVVLIVVLNAFVIPVEFVTSIDVMLAP